MRFSLKILFFLWLNENIQNFFNSIPVSVYLENFAVQPGFYVPFHFLPSIQKKLILARKKMFEVHTNHKLARSESNFSTGFFYIFARLKFAINCEIFVSHQRACSTWKKSIFGAKICFQFYLMSGVSDTAK